MKRVLILFLLLGFVLPAYSQLFKPKEEEVPSTYWKALDRKERKEVREDLRGQRKFEKEAQDQFDFFIPEVPLPVPDAMSLAGDTWYRQYLECADYEDTLSYKGTFVMAILDTGEPDHKGVVRYKYPGHVSKSYTGEPVIDGHSHGTHVAGEQVYSDETDAFGVVKAAAEKGHFYQAYYKVCTNGGGCSFTWIARAIRDHTQFYLNELKPKGIRSGITMSIGGPQPSTDVENAMKEAEDAGMLIFASAGNNGQENLSFPAQSEFAQAIGAHDSDSRKASFSNWGSPTEALFATAPGVTMYSTCKGDSKCIMSGTSMSCPIYAGMAGLVWIVRPEWTGEQVLNHLASTGYDLGDPGFDKYFGHGTPKYGSILKGLVPEKPDQPDDPGEPGPPPPEPPRKKRGVTFSIEDGYVGSWRAMDMTQLQPITFSQLEVRATGTAPTEQMFSESINFVHRFFADGRRSVIVPANWDYDTGIYWFGRFIEILAAKEGLDLDVVSIYGELATGDNAKFTGDKTAVKVFVDAGEGCTVELQTGGDTVIVPCSMATK